MDGAVVVAIFIAALVALAIGLWIAAVIYVFVDASKRKAPHPLLWAFGALCTGPVGFIAYLLDRPKGRQRACTFCAHTVLETDVHCPYCGRQLT